MSEIAIVARISEIRHGLEDPVQVVGDLGEDSRRVSSCTFDAPEDYSLNDWFAISLTDERSTRIAITNAFASICLSVVIIIRSSCAKLTKT